MKIGKRIIFLCLTIFLLVPINFSQQKSDHYKFARKKESEHFIFYWCKGDKVDIKSQECFYQYIVELFGINPRKGEKITYWKCRDCEHAERETHISADGGASILTKEIYSIYPWENHELIHILQWNYLSMSNNFFNEGLAVAFQIDPLKKCYTPCTRFGNGDKMYLNEYLKIIIAKGEYIKLENILTENAFRNRSLESACIAYAEAGSFVRYLINKYGLKTFFDFLEISDADDRLSDIKKNLAKIYNLSLENLENQWLRNV